MRRSALLGASLFSSVLAWAVAADAQVRDPDLEFRTVETEHFRVHYHTPLGVLARRVGVLAERANARLAPLLEHTPDAPIHIVLTDATDAANGSANAVPFNAIRLFATSPEDLEPLADYDDWLDVLVTHEHTHVVHLDNIGGLPALVNVLFGKVYAPNSVQPRWFLEGLAVYEESRHTAGGRIRSTMFDMYARMDALEGRLLTLAQLSNAVDRWPHGNSWYLYGSRFVSFIARRYGEDALGRMATIYGSSTLPYGLNRTARRATGKSFVELYGEFLDELRRDAQAAAREVEGRGRVEGRRLTFHGEDVRSPRYLDDRTLVYYVNDGRSDAQLRILALDRGESEQLARVGGPSSVSYDRPRGRVYYNGYDASRGLYYLQDLFVHDRRHDDTTRLTYGLRAVEPDVSPNGEQIVFTINGAGTTHLALARTADIEGSTRIVLRSARYEQIYTPRFSPDGRSVAFSRWQRGGWRDVQLLDVATGALTSVTADRAIDGGPTWSPDGRTLYFASDRTGISNVYAYDVASRETRQVTNVIAGAYQPAVSPDGTRLTYVGYTSFGHDLYELALEPRRFRRAPLSIDERPATAPTIERPEVSSEPYDPLPTLAPRNYTLELVQDGFGQQLAVLVNGGDVVGYHAYAARVGVSLETGDVQADLSWTLQRLRFPVTARVFRTVAPRRGLVVEGRDRTWIEEVRGAEIGTTFDIPGRFHSQAVGLSYRYAQLGKNEPFGGRLDPNDPPPILPELGRFTSLRLGWSFSSARRFNYDMTTSRGTVLGVAVSASHPWLGSRFEAGSVTWSAAQYARLPWAHLVAIRYGGGTSFGDLGRRGVFAVGGYPDVSVIQGFVEDAVLGGVALRGYDPFVRVGNQFHLIQAEYRLPLVRPMTGIDLLPAYVSRAYGAVFIDAGDAYSGDFRLSSTLVGIGAELLVDVTLGYYLAYTLRVGIARGLDATAGRTQVYAHLGFPF